MSTEIRPELVELGRRIRQARKQKGLKQKEIGEMTGGAVKQSMLAQGELGQKEFSRRNLILLAQLLENDFGDPTLAEYASKVFVDLPVMGEVCAGDGIQWWEEDEPQKAHVPARLVRPGSDSCVVRVRGDSMKNEGVMPGDYLVVRRQTDADAGEMVIAIHEGDTLLRRLAKKRPRYRLEPGNLNYPPIEATTDDVQIVAVVTGLIRSFI